MKILSTVCNETVYVKVEKKPLLLTIYRSSHLLVFHKTSDVKNLAKLNGKHLCCSVFFINVLAASLQLCEKGTPAQVFS